MEGAAIQVDVAIVGGGPGGLATAAAILSASDGHVRVKVFESLKQYTLQGSVVGLAANAQYALEAIHPNLLAKFLEHGLTVHPFLRYNLQGELVGKAEVQYAEWTSLYEKFGKRPLLLGWHEIRQLLFEYLPEGTVEFDKQMTHYDDNGSGVTIHFDRGQRSVQAKLLVGADGYFSRIRKQCLNDGPPMFSGMVMWRARIGRPEGMDKEGSSWRTPDTPIGSGPFAMLAPMGTLKGSEHKSWSWILGAPLSTLHAAGVEFDPNVRGLKAIQGDAQSGNALENALKIFAQMPANLMNIVRGTDPATVTQHGLYMRPLTEPSLHPLVMKPSSACKPPVRPVTPPQETETPLPPVKEAAAASTVDKQLQPNKAANGAQQPETDASYSASSAYTAIPAVGAEPNTAEQPGGDVGPSAQESVTKVVAAEVLSLDATLPQECPVTKDNSSDVPTKSAPTETNTSTSEKNPIGVVAGDDTTSGGKVGVSKGTGASPAVQWGKGRVTLMGDAAHATIPNGQGLALAIEDAVGLAWHLKREGLTETALRRYEQERPPRVKTIHLKGVDLATYSDKEAYIYGPTFRPLWCKEKDAEDASTCIKNFVPCEL